MTRDDSSGGWVPMDGGGLSNVSVRKRFLHHHHHHPAALPVVAAAATTTSSCNNNPASRSSSTSGGPGPPPHNSIIQQHEYLILGKRISDQTVNAGIKKFPIDNLIGNRYFQVVLSCTIRKDFQYNKVMPTFHHWRTGDQKFGLTFQTAADARAFDKGVRMAVEDLLDGKFLLFLWRGRIAEEGRPPPHTFSF